jgi:hypothetical protein
MYTIKDYSLARANQLGVIITPSTRKNKKIDVYQPNGDYITSIGALNYGDYPTYIETNGIEYANERRKRFYQRFKNIQTGTTMWYSANLLW